METKIKSKKSILGTWNFVLMEFIKNDGKVKKVGTQTGGMLHYGRDGSMSALITLKRKPRDLDDLIAYSGTYTMDLKSSTITHLPKVASRLHNVNTPLLRYASFRNSKLILENAGDSKGHYRVIWKRAKL